MNPGPGDSADLTARYNTAVRSYQSGDIGAAE